MWRLVTSLLLSRFVGWLVVSLTVGVRGKEEETVETPGDRAGASGPATKKSAAKPVEAAPDYLSRQSVLAGRDEQRPVGLGYRAKKSSPVDADEDKAQLLESSQCASSVQTVIVKVLMSGFVVYLLSPVLGLFVRAFLPGLLARARSTARPLEHRSSTPARAPLVVPRGVGVVLVGSVIVLHFLDTFSIPLFEKLEVQFLSGFLA